MINRVFCALAAVLAAGLFSAPAAAQTVESAYTALDLDKCRHTPSKEEEDYGEWRCSGYGGIAVHVSAGDQRSYVSYGRNAKNEPAAKQTLASFNGEGEKIEWRAERGADGKLKPFATIMRWSTTVSSGGCAGSGRDAGGDPPRTGRRLPRRLCGREGQSGRQCAGAETCRRSRTQISLRRRQTNRVGE
jgi:hypothetical protein